MRKWFLLLFKLAVGKEISSRIQVSCQKEYLGSEYGGWTICTEFLCPGAVVYSFGVGEDATFDLELINRFGADVFAFDPTPKSIMWVMNQDFPEQFHFFDYGISDHDGELWLYPPKNPNFVSLSIIPQEETGVKPISVPVFRLPSIMSAIGHDRIDILKLDIEGAEYSVLRDCLEGNLSINQILVEFHHRFPAFSISDTRRMVRMMKKKGFRLFSVSKNREEFGFIHKGCMDNWINLER